MIESTRALLEQVMKLPAAERVSLAYEILETIDDDEDELSPAWRGEIQRRVTEIFSGTAGPGEDYRVVMQRLRHRHEEKHGKHNG